MKTRLHPVWASCALGAALVALLGATCFTSAAPEKSYFVLHNKTSHSYEDRPIKGLLRVKTLHADAVYEKYQVAVRRNPYELRYDEYHVWVAKPKQMISDLIAQAINQSHLFTGVTRELGEVRPVFSLSGDLHAIEVYDSGDEWFAHLSMSLQLTRYDSGESLYFKRYDERRRLQSRSFSLAARALSELLAAAVDEMLVDLDRLPGLRAPAGEAEPPPDAPAASAPAEPELEEGAEADAASDEDPLDEAGTDAVIQVPDDRPR